MGKPEAPEPKQPLRHRLAQGAMHSAGHVATLVALHIAALEAIGIVEKVLIFIH